MLSYEFTRHLKKEPLRFFSPSSALIITVPVKKNKIKWIHVFDVKKVAIESCTTSNGWIVRCSDLIFEVSTLILSPQFRTISLLESIRKRWRKEPNQLYILLCIYIHPPPYIPCATHNQQDMHEKRSSGTTTDSLLELYKNLPASHMSKMQ